MGTVESILEGKQQNYILIYEFVPAALTSPLQAHFPFAFLLVAIKKRYLLSFLGLKVICKSNLMLFSSINKFSPIFPLLCMMNFIMPAFKGYSEFLFLRILEPAGPLEITGSSPYFTDEGAWLLQWSRDLAHMTAPPARAGPQVLEPCTSPTARLVDSRLAVFPHTLLLTSARFYLLFLFCFIVFAFLWSFILPRYAGIF